MGTSASKNPARTHDLSFEARLAIEHGATQVLAESTDFGQAAPRLIATVCQALGWECGAAWRLDSNGVMRCVDTWSVGSPAVREFLAHVRDHRPPRHPGGLLAQTWHTGEPVWIRDVAADATFRRAPLALRADLHSAFAFPIRSGRETLGVMEFFSREIREPDAGLLDCMTYVGSQVGQFCDRAEAQQRLRESEQRYHETFDLAPIGIAHVEPQTMRFMQVNRRLCELLGYTREELLQRTAEDISHPDDRQATRPARERLHAGEIQSFQGEKRYLRKDGSTVWVKLTIGIKRDADGRPLYHISLVEDITERKQAEEELRASQDQQRATLRLLDNIVENIPTAVQLKSVADGLRIKRWNKAAEQMYGVPADEAIGRTVFDLWPHDKAQKMHEADLELVARGEGMDEFPDREALTREGDVIRVHMRKVPLRDDGKVTHLLVIADDITDRKQAEERIHYLANHDALTELPNRHMFGQMLTHTADTARRYNRNFAVMFIDLDRFKFINDTLGHEAGDHLLRVVSSRLKTTLRASDVVARLGGDEFVVLLQEVSSAQQVSAVARKIISAVIKPMEISGHECRVTCSIGISMFPNDASDGRSLMKYADAAMYLAKEQGKNNFQFYTKDLKSASVERMVLETNLRRALERGEMSLHYQAKQDLRTNDIAGVEALLRWTSAELGPVSPAQFIPLAEETGLIVPIGRWVLRTACAQTVAWQKQGLPPVRMAVNLSPRQFADPGLIADIRTTFRDTGMAPELLELEITEGMVMHNPERAIEVLSQIKAMGVRLAIDDFGTGYSSLAQLKRFPIDTLKVDRSFIRDIPKDEEDKAITEAIIAMGKSLSLTVVAEGVETEAQRAFLQEHACDQMQGYYFSKPLPAEGFAELLRRHSRSTPPRPATSAPCT